MEVIKIRIAEKNSDLVEHDIEKLIKEFGNSGSIKNISLYRNAVVNNDLRVQLHWESAKVKPQGSDTGLCLVHLLKAFGLISYSVWVEEN
ncbi:MAG: hypothetical protein ABFD82_05645 [Syntrophaceae bacterium]